LAKATDPISSYWDSRYPKLAKKNLKYSYKTTPYSHQKKALTKIHRLKGVCGLFMEMGTGKTKVAIDWAGISYYNFGLRRVLVMCPVSVMGVWRRQIVEHSPVKHRISVLRGPVADRIHRVRLLSKYGLEDGIEWIVINYEGVWRESKNSSITDELIKWKPDLVIADESHRIKSSSARQSRAAARIAASASMRLALTGTPITKSPLDLFGQFRFLNPAIFGSNWSRFKNFYGVWGGFGKFQLRGYKNLPDLITKVRANSYRIKKEQCLDLPEKVYLELPVTLSPEGARIYREMAKEMIAEIKGANANYEAIAPIVLVKLLRLSQITSGFVKDTEGKVRIFDTEKLRTCLDLVYDMVSQDEKVVIFCRFRADIARLARKMQEKGIGHEILSGSVPSSRRDSIVERFQNDASVKVFIAQIHSGSLGIELTAASRVIFYSWDYRWESYVQAQDRIHRVGQTKKCTYYHLVVPRSIDTISLGILRDKGNIAHAVIHDPEILRPEI
jgi:SNF2 family DNA or RNA helicase